MLWAQVANYSMAAPEDGRTPFDAPLALVFDPNQEKKRERLRQRRMTEKARRVFDVMYERRKDKKEGEI